MLMRQQPTSPLPMLEEDGFTLVEMVVALAAGLVVLGALFSVIDVSLKHSTAVQDRVQANQLGRIAMTKMVDELHSACLSPGFTPVQSGSKDTELVFVNSYGPEAILVKASEHKIVFDSSAKTLTDKSYPSNGGSWPKFTFASTPTPSSGTLLASNVSQTEPGGKAVPVFRYYKYATASGSTEALPLNTINETPLTTPLTSTTAAEAASVQISFHSEANDHNTLNRGVDLNAQMTFSFSVPNSETPIHDAPCQ
jgi:prepilin-type N-terminal cleavage/methylation domain-containing protein